MTHCGKKINGINRRPSAFTLVELLVVMGIISMLMSILLPGLNSARESGNRIHCMTNIRGLSIAWMMYAQENDDRLCRPEPFNDPAAGFWVKDGMNYSDETLNSLLSPDAGSEKALKNGVLWPYLQTAKIYKCKSDSSQRLRSYSISATMHGTTPSGLGSPYYSLSQISRSSESLVFTDGGTSTGWLNSAFVPLTVTGDSNFMWDYNIGSTLSTRHHNGCNISFADMHCEYWKYKDARTVDFAVGKIPPAQAAEANLDLIKMIDLLRGG